MNNANSPPHGTLINLCIDHLWDRYTTLRKRADALQSEVIQLEFEKARLAYECDSIQRRINNWKHTEEGHQRMAMMLSEKMGTALKILCSTEVCSDGRSIADHMRDAHKKLGLLPDESEPEQEVPTSQDNEINDSSSFHF